jgi:hypothetical protein
MTTTCLDFKSLEQQLEQLKKEVKAHRESLESERRRSAELDEKVRKQTALHELEILRQLGLNLDALRAHGTEELEIVQHHLEQFKKSQPPEKAAELQKQGLKRQILQQWAGAFPRIVPPAFGCEPATASQNVACNATLAEINLRAKSTGLGGAWGLEAIATQPALRADLWWVHVPAKNSDLFVEAQVDVQGTVYIWSHDHWYTSTDAWVKLSLRCNLYQFYWERGAPLLVVDEAGPNLSLSYWVNGRFVPSNSTTVVAGMPVWIHVEAELEVFGRSDHALVEADFFSGADKFIRVPEIEVRLNPL